MGEALSVVGKPVKQIVCQRVDMLPDLGKMRVVV